MSKKRSGLRMSDLQQNRHLLLKMPVSVGAKAPADDCEAAAFMSKKQSGLRMSDL
ncbi:MAG: hypothetical protein PUB46_12140 [Lachnospiraceae bacterium]|nr:hypothetical protein [Lachnospiraceae bacterium]